MARARGSKELKPLIGGLITEQSDLDFPVGATKDELNFRFRTKGSARVKRKGLRRGSILIPNIVGDADATLVASDMLYWEPRDVVVVFNVFSEVNAGVREYYAVLSLFKDGVRTGPAGNFYFTMEGGDNEIENTDTESCITKLSQIDNNSVVITNSMNMRILLLEYDSGTYYVREQSVFFREYGILPEEEDTFFFNVRNQGFSFPYEVTSNGLTGSTLSDMSPLNGITNEELTPPTIYSHLSQHFQVIVIDGNTEGQTTKRVWDLASYNIEPEQSSEAPRGFLIDSLDAELKTLTTFQVEKPEYPEDFIDLITITLN